MQLKTILNRIQKFKSLVYGSIRWVEEAKEPTIEVELHLVPTADRSVLNVAAKRPGQRQVADLKIRVYPDMGHQGVFSMHHAGLIVQLQVSGWSGMPWSEGNTA